MPAYVDFEPIVHIRSLIIQICLRLVLFFIVFDWSETLVRTHALSLLTCHNVGRWVSTVADLFADGVDEVEHDTVLGNEPPVLALYLGRRGYALDSIRVGLQSYTDAGKTTTQNVP